MSLKFTSELIEKMDKIKVFKLHEKMVDLGHSLFKVDNVKNIVLKEIQQKVPKKEMVEILASNGFNMNESEQIIAHSLSTIFKNSNYWHRDDTDNLGLFVDEIDEEKTLEYKYKPASFKVIVYVEPDWYLIMEAIAEKNKLTALDYFRDFLVYTGFDSTIPARRKDWYNKYKNSLLTVGDISNNEKLKEILSYDSLSLYADEFKKGLLGKSFKFVFFGDTVTGKKIVFSKIPDPNRGEKDVKFEINPMSQITIQGRLLSQEQGENSLPKSPHLMFGFGSPEYYKYFPLLNTTSVCPGGVYFNQSTEFGVQDVYSYLSKDEVVRKLEWQRGKRFQILPCFDFIVDYLISSSVYLSPLSSDGDLPPMVRNQLKKFDAVYGGEVNSETEDVSIMGHLFQGKYGKVWINIEVFSSENTIYPMEYYNFDVEDGLRGIKTNLKELGYMN